MRGVPKIPKFYHGKFHFQSIRHPQFLGRFGRVGSAFGLAGRFDLVFFYLQSDMTRPRFRCFRDVIQNCPHEPKLLEMVYRVSPKFQR